MKDKSFLQIRKNARESNASAQYYLSLAYRQLASREKSRTFLFIGVRKPQKTVTQLLNTDFHIYTVSAKVCRNQTNT